MQLLFDRFVLEHFQAGVREVHLLFDKPSAQEFNSKEFEHARRDVGKSKNTHKQHEHISFSPQTPTPQLWCDYIQCRECKRSIVEAIGLSYLQKGWVFLHQNQTLILAGCFSGEGENDAWIIHPSDVSTIAEPLTAYQSNAVKADARIWRHATTTWATSVLIYSPDTDVYNIGLGLVDTNSKQYVVQINVPHSAEKRYLHLNHLYLALQNDSDLASLPRDSLGLVLQTLFICTGCDFISYFKTIGKATFLNVFSTCRLHLWASGIRVLTRYCWHKQWVLVVHSPGWNMLFQRAHCSFYKFVHLWDPTTAVQFRRAFPATQRKAWNLASKDQKYSFR